MKLFILFILFFYAVIRLKTYLYLFSVGMGITYHFSPFHDTTLGVSEVKKKL